MVSRFRDNSSSVIFWLLLLSIGLHSSFLHHPPELIASHGNGALGGIFYLAPPLPPVILVLCFHALLLLQALRINHIASEMRLYQKTSFSVAMAYVLLTALFSQWGQITPALVCNSLLIWLFGKMVRLQEVSLTRQVIYNIGMIAGLSVVLYHPAVTLVLLCLLALAILRPFRLNEWFIMLLGIITPFYFLLSILYLSNSLADIWLYIPEWSWHLPLPEHGRKTLLLTAIVLGMLVLAGIYLWRSQASRSLIQVRKAWSVLLFMLLLLLPVMIICKDAGFESGIMAMVPASVFIAGVFIFPRKAWLPAVVFWLLTALSLYNAWLQ